MADLTGADISAGLRDLGLAAGDTVMVHSSLSAFGHVQGGAQTVVEALLQVLGPAVGGAGFPARESEPAVGGAGFPARESEPAAGGAGFPARGSNPAVGTLVVPTFSRYLQGGETVWDREHTPSLMGAISEAVRTRPEALRSSHAAHPLAAIGPNAQLLCGRPHKTGFGPDSPFKTLVEINAWILLMGVTYSNCTLMHLLEAEAKVPYRFVEWRPATVILDGIADPKGGAWEYTRKEAVANDFLTFGGMLEQRGLVRRGRIGDSEQRLLRAGDLYEVGMALMRQDPLLLLTEESRAQWRGRVR